MDDTRLLGSAVLYGLASHVIFQRREPHIFAFFAYLAVTFAGGAALAQHAGKTVALSLGWAWLLETVALTAMSLSIAVYRLYINPLKRFPGPTAAALSKWWMVKHAGSGRTPQVIKALHEQYGDVVRIGPNELSVRNLEAVQTILSNKGKMQKGAWYDGSFAKKGQSVHALKTIEDHAVRRAFWDKGFSGPALQQYSVYIKNRGDEFVDCLRKLASKGEDINMSLWSSWLAFDVMGDIGFGDGFGMMEKAKTHHYMAFIETAMQGLATFSEVPWLVPLLASLPAGKAQVDMYEFSMMATKRRLQQGQSRHDLFSYFIKENGSLNEGVNIFELDADVRTVIIAGSDTTASVLTFTFEYLSRHPEIRKQLQAEIEEFRGQDIDINKIAPPNLPILNAVINETLRVRPVVPSKSQRTVPAGGVEIAGVFVPGGTHISTPQRAVMLDERYFGTDAGVWRPERWLEKSKSGSKLEQRAFIPFSQGPFNCAGRLLALLELRLFIIMAMLAFDIEPASGHDAKAFDDHILEYFTVQKEKPFMARLKTRTA